MDKTGSSRAASSRAGAWQRPRAQQGMSLVLALSMLLIVMLLQLSAAHVVLQNEKAARNDRDRQLAFQSAEAALLDAEADISQAPGAAGSRSAVFASASGAETFVQGCGAGIDNPLLGLCRNMGASAPPAWQTADFMNDDPSAAKTVPYGRFTGHVLQASDQRPPHGASSGAPLPARLPRYIIEALAYNKPGEAADADRQAYFYRVTAMGFGMRDSTRVILQTVYLKE